MQLQLIRGLASTGSWLNKLKNWRGLSLPNSDQAVPRAGLLPCWPLAAKNSSPSRPKTCSACGMARHGLRNC